MLMLSGCRAKRALPVIRIVKDTVKVLSYQVDSIYVSDSTVQKALGDTLMIERWHKELKSYRSKDTLTVHSIDSVPYEVPVEVPVEVVRYKSHPMLWYSLAFNLLIVVLASLYAGYKLKNMR